MSSIKEYKVVSGADNVALEKKVNNLIISGWVPQGGVSVIPETTESLEWHYQAMVKMEYSVDKFI